MYESYFRASSSLALWESRSVPLERRFRFLYACGLGRAQSYHWVFGEGLVRGRHTLTLAVSSLAICTSCWHFCHKKSVETKRMAMESSFIHSFNHSFTHSPTQHSVHASTASISFFHSFYPAMQSGSQSVSQSVVSQSVSQSVS